MDGTKESRVPLPEGTTRWLRRLGALGILFFLVKGLAWIAAAAAAAWLVR